MTDHLVRAAKARHAETLKRATTALLEMAKTGDPVTFAAVARRAGVSTDFLYNTPSLRTRITNLREQPSTASTAPSPIDTATSTTAIRALSAQLKQQRRQHRGELQALQKALAAAHGENLLLRRRLSAHEDVAQ